MLLEHNTLKINKYNDEWQAYNNTPRSFDDKNQKKIKFQEFNNKIKHK